ncbi:hypothetical protein C8R44DRAFT_864950 [Mycena epipterygia]|nr:hypothetical protein C8R44DRAFT_864950 [Mycena epipterygia]
MVHFRALLFLFATVAIAGVSALPSKTGGLLTRSADDVTCASTWGQCGGVGWTGPLCCADVTQTCVVECEFYHQCLPAADT